MGSSVTLSNLERQELLLRFVEEQQRVSIDQVCERFSVSTATARRDLDRLAQAGKVRRFRGGALAVSNTPPEPPLSLRGVQQVHEKRRIGQAVATLVADGETVFLGSGSTVLQVANHLGDRQNLTVITNSLAVMNALADIPRITLVCLGGILRSSERSLIGHITEQNLAELRVDKVIMGIRAVDIEHGLTNDYLPETQTDRAILRIGRQVILIADYTKCGLVSTALVAPLKAIDIFVTDTQTPAEFVSAVAAEGIRVLTV